MSHLTNGNVPAGENCPWKSQCEISLGRHCDQSVENNIEFSCAVARGYDIVKHSTDEDNARLNVKQFCLELDVVGGNSLIDVYVDVTVSDDNEITVKYKDQADIDEVMKCAFPNSSEYWLELTKEFLEDDENWKIFLKD